MSDVGPIFLERRSYRRRRMFDGLRVLPILGAMLWMLPLFWPETGAEQNARAGSGAAPVTTSTAMAYLFLIWIALIAASAALWFVLRGHIEALPADIDIETEVRDGAAEPAEPG